MLLCYSVMSSENSEEFVSQASIFFIYLVFFVVVFFFANIVPKSNLNKLLIKIFIFCQIVLALE